MQQASAASSANRGVYQSLVHSHTLPVISNRPYPLGGNEPTGDDPSYPSLRRFCHGNSPCQVLAIILPPGANSLPQEYVMPSSPPRAANSHSASDGSSLPT